MTVPTQLPKQFEKYFWDVSFQRINPEKKYQYVIERLLEYGDLDALRWVERVYGKRRIKQVVKESNRLSAKSANFYAILYHIPRDQIRCIQPPDSQSQPKTLWPH